MGKPNTSKSKCLTIRMPVSELNILENLGAEHGISRHAIIRRALTEAIQSGRVHELAKTKTPA